jgi:hypothetical protein
MTFQVRVCNGLCTGLYLKQPAQNKVQFSQQLFMVFAAVCIRVTSTLKMEVTCIQNVSVHKTPRHFTYKDDIPNF